MKTVWILIVTSAFVYACSPPASDSDTDQGTNSDNDAGTTDRGRFQPAVLPDTAAGDCEAVTGPVVCDWAQSVDAVIVGTIDAVRPLTSPVWVHQGPDSHEADQCDGDFVNIGVTFELTVTDALYGDTSEQIVVHAGSSGMDNWAEQPVETNGELEWLGRRANILEVGTTVGMAITKVPDVDKWSLMGELPFTFESDGSTVFAGAACAWASPHPQPSDFAALLSELEACEVTHNDLYEVRVTNFTQRPHFSHAASCHYAQ